MGRTMSGESCSATILRQVNDVFHVAIVGPVIHYTMGGVSADHHGRVTRADGSHIPGLFAAGEVIGGIHGANRLGGSSLLDCVVFGRLSGASASKYLLDTLLAERSRPGTNVNINVSPEGEVTVSSNGTSVSTSSSSSSSQKSASASTTADESEIRRRTRFASLHPKRSRDTRKRATAGSS